MANIECNKCGDMVDVEARTVTLPFVCKWCTEDFEPKTPLDSIIDDEDWREPGETETLTSTSTPSQFDLDSELIEDLQSQLEEANRNREEWIEKYASLITEIGIKDARIRVLESEVIERNSAVKERANSRDYYRESASFLYREYRFYEKLYFIERDKTWWERLWA